MNASDLTARVQERVREWQVVVTTTRETASSFIAFGTRGERAVVLKVVGASGDEWRVGETLEALGGRGTVRVLAHVPGAVLLERLSPGTSLVSLVLENRDDEATEIIAGVIQHMSRPREPASSPPTVQDWGGAFARYVAGGDTQVPLALVERARHIYTDLCGSQRQPRLLHGDLQHDNVLFDSGRGWVAIDPKGVVGEVEYEIGAALRNPAERPDLFASPRTVE